MLVEELRQEIKGPGPKWDRTLVYKVHPRPHLIKPRMDRGNKSFSPSCLWGFPQGRGTHHVGNSYILSLKHSLQASKSRRAGEAQTRNRSLDGCGQGGLPGGGAVASILGRQYGTNK